jgi:hypothetical protein
MQYRVVLALSREVPEHGEQAVKDLLQPRSPIRRTATPRPSKIVREQILAGPNAC